MSRALTTPGTYSAFCRNYGQHRTDATKIPRDWNAEVIDAMKGDLEDPWNDLIAAINNRQEALITVIEGSTEAAIEHLGKVLFNPFPGC